LLNFDTRRQNDALLLTLNADGVDRFVMKRGIFTYIVVAAFAAPVFAGSTVVDTKQVVPPPPNIGTGFYCALDAGINAYQTYRDNRAFDISAITGVAGDFATIDRLHKVGFAGGLKLGYVFGTGVIRPTIEEDIFYNGFQSSLRLQAFNAAGATIAGPVNSNVNVNSVAFMTNFLLRFAPGNQRFQPYIGAGIGGYYGSIGDVNLQVGQNFIPVYRSRSTGNFAWQAVAGADYYFTRTVSGFAEYKYLNYNNLGGGSNGQFGTTNLGQSLVVFGVRAHF